MHLHDALTDIAAYAGLKADELIAYAQEDTVGGRDTGNWSGESIHADEGRVIYALVRALKPKTCLEIGTAQGCSATHILTALERNKRGELYSYDVNPEAGVGIPAALRTRWHFNVVDALAVPSFPAADFVFEDGPHTFNWTAGMYERIRDDIRPRLMLTHDYYTHLVYAEFGTYAAFQQVFNQDRGVLLDGAFTGLGYMTF